MESPIRYVCESISRNLDGYPTPFFMEQQLTENTYKFIKADLRCPTNKELDVKSGLFDKIPDSIANPSSTASFIGTLNKFRIGDHIRFTDCDLKQAERCLGMKYAGFVVVNFWDFTQNYVVGVDAAEYEDKIQSRIKDYYDEKAYQMGKIPLAHEEEIYKLLLTHNTKCRSTFKSASELCSATLRLLTWAGQAKYHASKKLAHCPCCFDDEEFGT